MTQRNEEYYLCTDNFGTEEMVATVAALRDVAVFDPVEPDKNVALAESGILYW